MPTVEDYFRYEEGVDDGTSRGVHPLAFKVAKQAISYYAEHPRDHGHMGSLTHALLCFARDLCQNKMFKVGGFNAAVSEWMEAGCPVFREDESALVEPPSRIEVLLEEPKDAVRRESLFGPEAFEPVAILSDSSWHLPVEEEKEDP
jgi:hypothetical protein